MSPEEAPPLAPPAEPTPTPTPVVDAPLLPSPTPAPVPEPITPAEPASSADGPITPSTPPSPPTPSTPAVPIQPPPSPLLNTGGGTAVRSLLSRAKEKIQFRKRAKLEKIIAKALEAGSIGNDEVEKLLRVSDATASRYLRELVKTGRLRLAGRSKATRYIPAQ